MKISVLGAGSWGTTLAIHLSKNGHNVNLWERDRERLELLKQDRESKLFLPGISFPDELNITDNIELSISKAEMIVYDCFCRSFTIHAANSRTNKKQLE